MGVARRGRASCGKLNGLNLPRFHPGILGTVVVSQRPQQLLYRGPDKRR